LRLGLRFGSRPGLGLLLGGLLLRRLLLGSLLLGSLLLRGLFLGGLLLRLLLRRGGATTGTTDDREVGTDLDGRVLLDEDRGQGAGHGGWDLGVDLVGGDLKQRLVDLDLVALGLQPLRDRALGDRLTERRHAHGGAVATGATTGVVTGGGGLLGLLLGWLLGLGGLLLGWLLFLLLVGLLGLGGCGLSVVIGGGRSIAVPDD